MALVWGMNQAFTLRMEVPEEFKTLPKLAPSLIYPVQLAALGNWEITQSKEEGWPRVDLMPETGVLIWIVQGSVSFDYREMPAQGKWFNPGSYTYLGPKDLTRSPAPGEPGLAGTERAVSGSDAVVSPWPNCESWARLIPIASAAGETVAEPSYMVFYMFRGVDGPSLDVISGVVQSAVLEYT